MISQVVESLWKKKTGFIPIFISLSATLHMHSGILTHLRKACAAVKNTSQP